MGTTPHTYHPLPEYPTLLTIADIHKEKGHNPPYTYSLKELAMATDGPAGVGIPLNETDNPAAMIAKIRKDYPYNGVEGDGSLTYPYSIEDWHEYMHPHNYTFTTETQEIAASEVDLFQLVCEKEENILIAGIDGINRLEKNQTRLFNAVRRSQNKGIIPSPNDVPTVTSTPVSSGILQVYKDTQKTSSTNTNITVNVKRVVVRVNLQDVQRLKLLASGYSNGVKVLIGAKFRLNGLTKTITDALGTAAGESTPDQTFYIVLYTYYPMIDSGDVITTENWTIDNRSAYTSVLATNGGYYATTAGTGNFEITLNWAGINLISSRSKADLDYAYFMISFYRYDRLGDVWWGNNRIIDSRDSDMSNAASNWLRIAGNVYGASTFTLTKSTSGTSNPMTAKSEYNYETEATQPWYDNHSTAMKLDYHVDDFDLAGSDKKLGVNLNSDYIRGWSDDDVSYGEPGGYTVEYYTIKFHYAWKNQPYEFYILWFNAILGEWIKNPLPTTAPWRESILDINGEKIGSGWFRNGLFGERRIFLPDGDDWNYAIWSENLSDPGSMDGITIYLLYNDYPLAAGAQNGEEPHYLFLDNVGIYKSMNILTQYFEFELQSNPLLLTYKVVDDVPTLSITTPTSIQETQFTAQMSNINDRGSTIKSWGWIWNEGTSTPTYATHDGIYELTYDTTDVDKPNSIHPLTSHFHVVTGLSPNTKYQIIAFCQNWSTKGTPAGYGYSTQFQVITLGPPEVDTWGSSGVDAFAATLIGIHTKAGNPASYIDCGFYWIKGSATEASLIASGARVTIADYVGSFSKPITLDGSTSQLYSFMAFAKNSTGEGYGAVDTFVTPSPT